MTRSGNADAAPNKPRRSAAAISPGNVTVAVLNATTVPGLAAALRDQVAAAGFKKGTINNYSDHQLAESVVQYAPGRQAEAKAVSRRLGISRREPVTADSRALAGRRDGHRDRRRRQSAVAPAGAYRRHIENQIRAGNTALP